MLFAAVQYAGTDHPLAAHYPIIAGKSRPSAPAFPHFRDFCIHHRRRIVELIESRRTQTNVVRRCTCLLPAFSIVCRETSSSLALIDLGASAGLNLNFDRYAYSYQRDKREVLRWGQAGARVGLEAELRGDGAFPPLPSAIPVASRHGIDLEPVDLGNPDQLLWKYCQPAVSESQGRSSLGVTGALSSSGLKAPMAARPDLARACRASSTVDRRGGGIQEQRHSHARGRRLSNPARIDPDGSR